MVTGNYDLVPMSQRAQIGIKVFEILDRPITRQVTSMDENVASGDTQRPMFAVRIRKNDET